MPSRFKLIPAVFLILARNNKILLLRRFNTGWEDGNYTLVSGHLNGDESATVAICREAKEEADLIINPNDLEIVHVMHRKTDSVENERIDFYQQFTFHLT
ncbi:NUDIX domain-containing protein [Candidatus Curtissbacteria bacterium]|nr:NUDIX domain-containing protein [Candidatus Curtissbacteria bacterium]